MLHNFSNTGVAGNCLNQTLPIVTADASVDSSQDNPMIDVLSQHDPKLLPLDIYLDPKAAVKITQMQP